MADIVITEFISLDGVVEDPGGAEGFVHGGWTFPYWNDEIAAFKLDETLRADALLLGRVTYEGFAAAWPGRTDEQGFADKMNAMPKYVVSATLVDPEWSNTTVVALDEVASLKERHEGDVLVAGSASLARALVEDGLADELRLLVYPVALGTGKRLFGEGGKQDLRLARSEAYSSGVVNLTYRR
ncbi:MAG TPA: dihydrofolate reductase family protein [Gaiellaceae bacterium]|jgi:dihydrofolate reductase|nr:dihydrofolate reductase family protein [Gaiellaceae bacterium]